MHFAWSVSQIDWTLPFTLLCVAVFFGYIMYSTDPKHPERLGEIRPHPSSVDEPMPE